MAADASIRLAVEGGSSFKQAMQAAESSVKLFNTQLKNLANEMSRSGANEANYTKQATLLANAASASRQKVALLTQEQDKQKKKLDELVTALQKAKQETGENSVETEKAANAVNKQVKVVNDLGIKLSNAQSEADKFDNELKEISNDSSNGGQNLQNIGDSAKNMGDSMGEASGKILSFKQLMGANIFGGLITQGINLAVNELRQFVREIINVGTEYEAQMAKVSAISGAYKDVTGKTMKEMEDLTRQLSGYFTATEIGQAMEFEAMAGWSVDEIKEATQAILDLAQAGSVDLMRASELMTQGLNGFGLGVEDAYHYADVLAVTASSAATSVDDMGDVFAKVAPIAGVLGFDIEDVSLAVGLLANNGLKGARAGTSLQKIMTNLAAPSAEVEKIFDELNIDLKDADGNFVGFEEILSRLRDAFAGLPTDKVLEYAKEIAGAGNASTAFVSLINATEDDFSALSAAIDDSAGAAHEMAEVMGDTYQGATNRAKAATQNLQQAIFSVAEGPLKNMKSRFADFANGLADMIRNGSPVIKIIKDIGEGLITFGIALAGIKIAAFIASLGGLTGVIGGLSAAFKALNASLGAFGLVAMAITAVITAIKVYGDTVGFAVDETTALSREISASAQAISDAAREEMDAYAERQKTQEEQVITDLAHLETTKMMANELLNLVDANGEVAESDRDRAEFLIGQLNGALGTELELVGGLVKGQEDLAAAIDAAIKKKEAQILLEANEEDYINGLKNYRQTYEDLAGAENLLADAEANLAKAKSEQQKVQEKYDEAYRNTGDAFNEYYTELENANGVVYEAAQAYGDASIAVTELRDKAETELGDVIQYENMLKDYTEGNTDSIIESYGLRGAKLQEVADLQGKTYEQQERELREQAEKEIQIYADMHETIGQNEDEFSKQRLLEQQNRVEASIKAYDELGTGSVNAYASALEGGAGVVEAASIAMVSASAGAKGTAQQISDELGSVIVSGISRILRVADFGSILGERLLAARTTAKRYIESNSPSKLFAREIGVPIAEGVAVGIEEGTKAVDRAFQNLLNLMTGSLDDNRTELITYSRNTADRVTDAIQKEIDKAAKDVEIWDEFFGLEGELETIQKDAEKIKELKEKLGKADVEEREKILKEIQKIEDDYNKKQVDAAMKAEQSAAKERQKYWESMKKDFERQIEEIEKKTESMAKKISDYGELFTKTKTETGEIFSLNDLDKDIAAIEKYGEALSSLQARGVDESLLSEITSMNLDDATAYMNELLDMTDEQYDTYMAKWAEKQQLARDIAQEFYKSEMEEVSREMLNTMQDFKTQFDATGKYLIVGVAQGIAEGESTLMNQIQQTIQNGIDLANSMLDIHSPSRVFAKIGKNMAAGLGVGWLQEMQNVNEDIKLGLISTQDTLTNAGIMHATAAAVNGINASNMMTANNGQPVYVQVVLDGRQIAQAVFDPLKQVSKQRGAKLG